MVFETASVDQSRIRYWKRFSLKTLLIIVTAVAVLITSYRAYRAWFLNTYPGYYVQTVGYSLDNGASVEEVATYFHSFKPASKDDMATVLEVWSSNGWEIDAGDEFFLFTVNQGHGKWCQFRNGRLVNHEQPQDPVRIMELNDQPWPPWFLRLF